MGDPGSVTGARTSDRREPLPAEDATESEIQVVLNGRRAYLESHPKEPLGYLIAIVTNRQAAFSTQDTLPALYRASSLPKAGLVMITSNRPLHVKRLALAGTEATIPCRIRGSCGQYA